MPRSEGKVSGTKDQRGSLLPLSVKFLSDEIPLQPWAEIVAYVRRQENAAEYSYPLKKVWACIPEVVASLGWSMEAVDDAAHRVKVKTKSGLFAWGSVFLIDAVAVNDTTTRVNVKAETPVTAITGLVDFGRTGQMIDVFFQELQRQCPN